MDEVKKQKEKEQFSIGLTFEGKNGLLEFSPLKNNKVTCLYFSASYSPPCQAFSPLLINFYNEVNSEDKVLEVILVPFDQTKEEFLDYFKPMPWLSIPFGDERVQKLQEQFKVTGIPKLIVLKQNGEVASSHGRQDVIADGEDAYEKWKNLVEN